MSKIKNKECTIKESWVNVPETILEVANCIKMYADKKNQTIQLQMDLNLPNNLKTDSRRLQQIVNNLLGNAIKFSPEGAQTSIQAVYSDEENLLSIVVIDQGERLT